VPVVILTAMLTDAHGSSPKDYVIRNRWPVCRGRIRFTGLRIATRCRTLSTPFRTAYAGTGICEKATADALGEPIGGRNRALDALAEYTNSHKYSLSPFARNGLTESAQRGQQLFLSAETQCAEVSFRSDFFDSQPRPASEIVRHDVGTGQDDPSELMEPMYDTPTLLGIYRSAPYLHHGKAETLHDVLTTFNKHDHMEPRAI
jgi:hypothetical protein